MSRVITLDNNNFEKEVIGSSIPILVDFWAEWCMPCKMMAPVLDEISEELSGKLKIAKLNIESPEHQELAIKYDIMSIPNMKVFQGGKVVRELIGFRPKEQLLDELAGL